MFSDQRIRDALDAGRIGVWRWEVGSDRLEWSPNLETIHGLAPGVFQGVFSSFADDIHPADRDVVMQAIEAALAAGGSYEVQYRLPPAADGSVRWIEARGTAEVRDGVPVAMTGICHDITGRKRAEERLRIAAEAAGLGVFEWSVGEDRAVWENDRAYEIFGLSSGGRVPARQEFLEAFLHPDDVPAFEAALEDAMQRGEHFHAACRIRRRPDGALRWIEVHGDFDLAPDGTPLRLVGVVADVTEARQAEAALSESEERLRILTDALPVLISYVDADCRYRFNNAAYEAWFGHAREEIRGRHLSEVLGEEAWAVLRPHAEAALAGRAVAYEALVPYRDGGPRHVNAQYVPHSGAEGRIEGFFVLVADVTARKRAEEARDLLVHELDHRVKNTLSIVQSLASQTFRPVPEAAPALDAFRGRIDALSAAHAVLTREHWEQADLASIVAQALQVGDCGERVRIAGPPVVLQPKQAVAMAMALHELCTNAIKYGALSNETGSVSVEWSVTGAAEPRLVLDWHEEGGPPVAEPAHRGFGSTLIERALASDLDGASVLEFRADGVRCRLEARLGPQVRAGLLGQGGIAAQ